MDRLLQLNFERKMQEMEEDGGDESDEEIRELKRRFVSDVILSPFWGWEWWVMSESDESDQDRDQGTKAQVWWKDSLCSEDKPFCRLKMRRSELRETSAKNKTPVGILRCLSTCSDRKLKSLLQTKQMPHKQQQCNNYRKHSIHYVHHLTLCLVAMDKLTQLQPISQQVQHIPPQVTIQRDHRNITAGYFQFSLKTRPISVSFLVCTSEKEYM